MLNLHFIDLSDFTQGLRLVIVLYGGGSPFVDFDQVGKLDLVNSGNHHPRICTKDNLRHQFLIIFSSSSRFCSIRGLSPRDSTLSRSSGSVFDERRLKRQLPKSMLTPSISSS